MVRLSERFRAAFFGVEWEEAAENVFQTARKTKDSRKALDRLYDVSINSQMYVDLEAKSRDQSQLVRLQHDKLCSLCHFMSTRK